MKQTELSTIVESSEAARFAIEAIKEIIASDVDPADVAVDRFWTVLGDWLKEARPGLFASRVVADEPHNATEAEKFGNYPMPFGKFEGTPIKQVDIGYLLWMDGRPDFRRGLRRYLASQVGQDRQED